MKEAALMPPSYRVSFVPLRGVLEYQGPPPLSVVTRMMVLSYILLAFRALITLTIIYKVEGKNLDINLVDSFIHTGQNHVSDLMRRLFKLVFASIPAELLPVLLWRQAYQRSVQCHEGEIQEQRLGFIMFLDDSL